MTNKLYPAPKAAIDKTGTTTFCRIGLCEFDPRGRSTRMRSSHRKQGVFPVLPNSPLLPDPGKREMQVFGKQPCDSTLSQCCLGLPIRQRRLGLSLVSRQELEPAQELIHIVHSGQWVSWCSFEYLKTLIVPSLFNLLSIFHLTTSSLIKLCLTCYLIFHLYIFT